MSPEPVTPPRPFFHAPMLHLLAGGSACALLGLVDGYITSTRVGLEPLEPVEQYATLTLLTFLNMSTGVLLGLGVGLAVAMVMRWVPQEGRQRALRLARHPAVMVPACVAAGVAFYIWQARKEINWDAVPWTTAALGLGAVGIYGLICVVMRSSSLRAIAIGQAALVVTGGLVLLGWSRVDEGHPEGLMRVSDESITGARLLNTAHWLADADDDGYPTWLCSLECDCSDDSPSIHPGARDVPDNGIDEDCNGRDRSAADMERLQARLGKSPRPQAKPREEAPLEAVVEEEPSILELSAQERPNVLMISIDTLRADHLGFHGYSLPTSPNMDVLAARSVVFDRAMSTGSMTRYSMPAMLTGKYFTEIQRSFEHWPELGPEELTFGERLQAEGYHTAAFHGIEYFEPKHGFAQGFDHYDISSLKANHGWRWSKTSDYITDQAIDYVRSEAFQGRGDAPWLLWVYYGDPHAGWMSHSKYERLFDKLAPNSDVSKYDQEIRFTDEHIGRLLEDFERNGLLQDTIIVLHSDHGEGLIEEEDHGHKWHGFNLYQEVIHVPFIIAAPGLEPARVDTPVSLIDFVPTMLELLEMPPDPEQRGISLVPWLLGERPDHPPLFFQRVSDKNVNHQHGMIAWPYKVIWYERRNRFRVFHLEDDPGETRSILGKLPEDTKSELTELMMYWFNDVLVHREPELEP